MCQPIADEHLELKCSTSSTGRPFEDPQTFAHLQGQVAARSFLQAFLSDFRKPSGSFQNGRKQRLTTSSQTSFREPPGTFRISSTPEARHKLPDKRPENFRSLLTLGQTAYSRAFEALQINLHATIKTNIQAFAIPILEGLCRNSHILYTYINDILFFYVPQTVFTL